MGPELDFVRITGGLTQLLLHRHCDWHRASQKGHEVQSVFTDIRCDTFINEFFRHIISRDFSLLHWNWNSNVYLIEKIYFFY